jgi:DNA-binding NtrC family response regulator
MRESILLVEDKLAMRNMLTTALEEEGWMVTAVASGSGAMRLLSEKTFDLIISDVCLPGDCSGMDVLARARECCHWTPVVLMTAFGTVDMAVKAMKDGARDFITKPFELNEFLAMVRRYTLTQGTSLVGSSRALLEATARARKGARTDLNVLVLGESGTGKELLSRMIHAESRFHEGPFVPVNCAAIPRELMESELFGAEKGAYTGADRSRPGRFELAEGGTIFLDEIADLDPALQGKLLRVLQEREYSRVGGTELKRTGARVIAASNRDLEAETAAGVFRKDLFFRLGEFPVVLPPLRDRQDDIPVLAAYFLQQSGHPGIELSAGALARLSAHSWPGNVRELRSIVLRAAALCGGSTIDADILEVGCAAMSSEGLLEESSRVARNREGELIRSALEKTGGNRREAAVLLKVSYRTLLSRLKELGLQGT